MEPKPTLEPVKDTEDCRRIREIAYEVGAFLTGDFTLTSGKKSRYYIDGKRMTLTPEGAYRIGRAIFDELSGSEVDAVGGVATGAYPMVTALAVVSYQAANPLPVFVVREETKGYGTNRRIEGHLKEGARVAILEDVLTTGGSVMKAIKAVEAAGAKVVKVIAIVDRDEGGRRMLEDAGYDFTALLRVAF